MLHLKLYPVESQKEDHALLSQIYLMEMKNKTGRAPLLKTF